MNDEPRAAQACAGEASWPKKIGNDEDDGQEQDERTRDLLVDFSAGVIDGLDTDTTIASTEQTHKSLPHTVLQSDRTMMRSTSQTVNASSG